ncbi:hypothetical protein LSH36_49g00028 [Paralvinella palmiformis]|uniref:Uncharacterized protein n=1 Tax=Paralvinella palmiformis TaxID=53620 RepID=A0AAD9NEN0_9ANNE|nr:hypothetical protein LSH36_49g00028 [Paralvinella palmiformis]
MLCRKTIVCVLNKRLSLEQVITLEALTYSHLVNMAEPSVDAKIITSLCMRKSPTDKMYTTKLPPDIVSDVDIPFPFI